MKTTGGKEKKQTEVENYVTAENWCSAIKTSNPIDVCWTNKEIGPLTYFPDSSSASCCPRQRQKFSANEGDNICKMFRDENRRSEFDTLLSAELIRLMNSIRLITPISIIRRTIEYEFNDCPAGGEDIRTYRSLLDDYKYRPIKNNGRFVRSVSRWIMIFHPAADCVEPLSFSDNGCVRDL